MWSLSRIAELRGLSYDEIWHSLYPNGLLTQYNKKGNMWWEILRTYQHLEKSRIQEKAHLNGGLFIL